ncbi:MAG: hypothetical protein QXI16_02720 [Sulfolobaceae archaeon]
MLLITELYNGIYRTLANDEQILSYLNIDITLPEDELLLVKAKKIQKRRKPQELIQDNLPLISFYSVGGGTLKRNSEVYMASFVFDIYTYNDVELAQQIANRIFEIFNRNIPLIPSITTFETDFEEAFESIVNGVSDIYCFTIVLDFYVGM